MSAGSREMMFHFCEPYFHAINRWIEYDDIDTMKNHVTLVAKLANDLILINDLERIYEIVAENPEVPLLPAIKPSVGENFSTGLDHAAFNAASKLVDREVFQIAGLYFQKHLLRALSLGNNTAKRHFLDNPAIIAISNMLRLSEKSGPAHLDAISRAGILIEDYCEPRICEDAQIFMAGLQMIISRNKRKYLADGVAKLNNEDLNAQTISAGISSVAQNTAANESLTKNMIVKSLCNDSNSGSSNSVDKLKPDQQSQRTASQNNGIHTTDGDVIGLRQIEEISNEAKECSSVVADHSLETSSTIKENEVPGTATEEKIIPFTEILEENILLPSLLMKNNDGSKEGDLREANVGDGEKKIETESESESNQIIKEVDGNRELEMIETSSDKTELRGGQAIEEVDISNREEGDISEKRNITKELSLNNEKVILGCESKESFQGEVREEVMACMDDSPLTPINDVKEKGREEKRTGEDEEKKGRGGEEEIDCASSEILHLKVPNKMEESNINEMDADINISKDDDNGTDNDDKKTRNMECSDENIKFTSADDLTDMREDKETDGRNSRDSKQGNIGEKITDDGSEERIKKESEVKHQQESEKEQEQEKEIMSEKEDVENIEVQVWETDEDEGKEEVEEEEDDDDEDDDDDNDSDNMSEGTRDLNEKLREHLRSKRLKSEMEREKEEEKKKEGWEKIEDESGRREGCVSLSIRNDDTSRVRGKDYDYDDENNKNLEDESDHITSSPIMKSITSPSLNFGHASLYRAVGKNEDKEKDKDENKDEESKSLYNENKEKLMHSKEDKLGSIDSQILSDSNKVGWRNNRINNLLPYKNRRSEEKKERELSLSKEPSSSVCSVDRKGREEETKEKKKKKEEEVEMKQKKKTKTEEEQDSGERRLSKRLVDEKIEKMKDRVVVDCSQSKSSSRTIIERDVRQSSSSSSSFSSSSSSSSNHTLLHSPISHEKKNRNKRENEGEGENVNVNENDRMGRHSDRKLMQKAVEEKNKAEREEDDEKEGKKVRKIDEMRERMKKARSQRKGDLLMNEEDTEDDHINKKQKRETYKSKSNENDISSNEKEKVKSKSSEEKVKIEKNDKINWTKNHFSIGTEVANFFYRKNGNGNTSALKPFYGTVTKYLKESSIGANDELYHILWADGDEEDYDQKDLKTGKRTYKMLLKDKSKETLMIKNKK